MKGKKLDQLKEAEMQLYMIYAFEDNEVDPMSLSVLGVNTEEEEQNKRIEVLTEEYANIFQEPTTLPLFRDKYNHKIVLTKGTNPVNQRPYRYDVYQKDEIDKMVQELLKTGIVQPSSSSYDSPLVLVKKKDNTWRLCVDYRKLNNMTLKERFPIQLIDDLMDEMGGSAVY